MESQADTALELERLRSTREEALQAARSAVRDTTRVTRLLTLLSEPAPIELLLDSILSALSELFLAEIVMLLYPAGTGDFEPVASIGLPEDLKAQVVAELGLAETFDIIKKGVALGGGELRRDPRVDARLRSLGVESIAWIPMTGSRETRGAMILARCKASPFTHDEINLLSAMAYRVALTLEQIQHKQQLELIVRGSREIGRHLEESSITREAVRSFPLIMGAASAALFSAMENGSFRCEYASGELEAIAPGRLFLTKPLADDPAAELDEICCVTDAGEHFAFSDSQEFRYRSAVAAPIFREERPSSLLVAFRLDSIGFVEETKQIASLYSRQVATALENARLYGALQGRLREGARIAAALRESEERFKALMRKISDVVAVMSGEGEFTYVGGAAHSLWGQRPEDLVGTPLLARVHPEDLKPAGDLILAARERPGENLCAVIRLRDGQAEDWRYFDVILTNLLTDSSVAGIVSTFHDVTERKLLEQDLTEKAFRDPLTGLANRAHFRDRLRLALARADEQNLPVAIIFFDLDNFKRVNDSLGHAAGDETLRVVADRLRGCLRSYDTPARLGGDEFTILLDKIKDVEQLRPVVDRLQAALNATIRIGEHDLCVGGSIGIAMSIPNSDDVESLMHKADSAMYRAKRSGKGRSAIFDPRLDV